MIDFINLSRERDRRERTMAICPYVAISPNTEEAIQKGLNRTSLQMNPNIDCMGGLSSYASCTLFKHDDRRFFRISDLVEGEKVMRTGMYLPSKEGHE